MAEDDNNPEVDDVPEGEPEGEPAAPDDKPPKEVDWRAMARKHERAAKAERKAREAAEAAVKDRDSLDKSEHEKAVEAARQQGEKAARETADRERRGDRLESATIRLASKGFKVDVDGEEHTLRYADADDAHTYIERMIRRGDLDEDDLFDEQGRVQTEALTGALRELLADKPHLAAGQNGSGTSRKVTGSADGGKGSGGARTLEEMSVAEHLKRIQASGRARV